MPKVRIMTAIRDVLDGDCGCEIYIKMREEPLLRKMMLFEGNPNRPEESLKCKIAQMIERTIRDQFLAEEAEFSLAENVEDNQKKFYVIRQDEHYEPFRIIDMPENQIGRFVMADRANAEGILFRFRIAEGKVVWAYQQIWATVIPNKRNEHKLIKALSPDQSDVFVEMQDTLFAITPKVDLLIVKSEVDEMVITDIVTANITLMQSKFGFETFIRATAGQVVRTISDIRLVANTDKLTDYIIRGNKRYAKKMMRIKHSPVLQMAKDDLKEKATTLDRWKGKFNFDDNGQIELKTFGDVENLIDLFDERYCRSDVTGKEYDTSVKSLATPI